jgi:hypothetical protein
MTSQKSLGVVNQASSACALPPSLSGRGAGQTQSICAEGRLALVALRLSEHAISQKEAEASLQVLNFGARRFRGRAALVNGAELAQGRLER